MFMAKGWGPTIERDGVICELPEGAKQKAAAPPRPDATPIKKERIKPLLPAVHPLNRRARLRALVALVALKHNVGVADIMGPRRTAEIVAAKYEATYRVRRIAKRWSFPQIGDFFGIDHTTAMHRVARYAQMTGRQKLCGYTIKKEEKA